MKSQTNKKLILVSGGMDSLWLLAKATQTTNLDNLFALHFQYGQKTQNKELECFRECLKHYNIPLKNQKILPLNFLPTLLKSSLTSTDINVNTSGIDTEGSILPTSYVPFRNTIFLSLALAWAETDNIDEVHIGAVSEDSLGYPDCRPVYYESFNHLIKIGSRDGKIKIETPIINLKKEKIFQDLKSWNAPFEKTWSCYQNNEVECGQCDSCILKAIN